MIIRPVQKQDQERWRVLWQAYLDFYNETLPEDITNSVWNRLFDDTSSLMGHVAEYDGQVVGFSNSIVHEATWTEKPICYLEDLYVDDTIRGKGIGRALIQNLIDMGKEKNWNRVYWHTDKENKRAQALYDKFTEQCGHVRYRVYLD